ncbi:unnamed protein product [Rotaria magnacalcarata]|uniref:Uncharacterized protein n=1 Tax=Rotaria magnacalcarata TaxID=392030 RepID=A0A816ZJ12_9BILA|nr:unnamed protein product [Rotaria magnacalcarata]
MTIRRFLIQVLATLYLVCIVKGQVTVSTQPSTCGCCPLSYCPTQSVPCSTNIDCECLMMAMTGGGMCTDTVLSCNDLVPCQNDNITCSTPNTVCVNNTRCEVPVCYPIDRASVQRCPPLTSTKSNSSTSKPVKTTMLIMIASTSKIQIDYEKTLTTVSIYCFPLFRGLQQL